MSDPAAMELVIKPGGSATCLYGEEIDLHALGRLTITRASHVEADADGDWLADMGPSGGPVLGPFRTRGEALAAEREWLVADADINRLVFFHRVAP